MKNVMHGTKKNTVRLIVPPQPATPPRPATPPYPAMPAWMDAWLDGRPSDLLETVPQSIWEASTPSFMIQRQSEAVCH
jgi:hypothetical protein